MEEWRYSSTILDLITRLRKHHKIIGMSKQEMKNKKLYFTETVHSKKRTTAHNM
jgi:hypothetical protein